MTSAVHSLKSGGLSQGESTMKSKDALISELRTQHRDMQDQADDLASRAQFILHQVADKNDHLSL